MFKLSTAAVALLLSLSLCRADTFTFQVRSLHKFTAQVEFYSQDRNAAWPGGNRAYLLDDDDVHTLRLNCRAREKICFGAWDKGQAKPQWGTGLNQAQPCTNCCWFCEQGRQTPIITLHTRRGANNAVVPFFTTNTPAPPKPVRPPVDMSVRLDDSQ